MKNYSSLFFSFSLLLGLLYFLPSDQSFHGTPEVAFEHGVASGDPLSKQVIIWTKVTADGSQRLPVSYQVSMDPEFAEVQQKGISITSDDQDYTVKVDLRNLQPATTYYYQFECFGVKSPIGRTRTLPEGDIDQIQLAVVSCSNYEWGYFNPLASLALRDSIDAVLHLGDYIYEYQISGYGDTTIGRIHEPPHELISLEDYRTRYAQYRSTAGFQAVHQQHPFITVWDDHEISNDSYVDGAENHQEEEGDYKTRRNAAKKAYYEWMPVRENKGALYRNFNFGNLVDLIMLDERLAGRTAPVDSLDDPTFQDSTRTMLGEAQRTWFFEQLKSSKATWKVIGNQVIFSDLRFGEVFPNRPLNLDAWDGYPYEKKTVIDFIQKNELQNIIFTTGDTHCSWAFDTPSDLEAYKEKGKAAVVAVEFGTTSISSGNYDEYTTIDTVRQVEQLYLKNNPHLKYVNLSEHGYLLLRINAEATTAEWHYTEGGLRQASDKERLAKKVKVLAGKPGILEIE